MMMAFFRDRGLGLAVVVLILFAISVAQGSISYTLARGPLRTFLPEDMSLFTTIFVVVRFCLVALLVGLWILKRKHTLLLFVIIANALFTLALLIHTTALIAVLFGAVSAAVDTLIVDVTLMSVSNILIFSVWYWIIDPPGVEEISRADEPWDFLFPQRALNVPHYESWAPHYRDYLFVAFTTNFAFSPSDTLPLTRRAKMLMLLQTAISVVTLTAIAGSAISILSSK
jgi:hypothetical protein